VPFCQNHLVFVVLFIIASRIVRRAVLLAVLAVLAGLVFLALVVLIVLVVLVKIILRHICFLLII